MDFQISNHEEVIDILNKIFNECSEASSKSDELKMAFNQFKVSHAEDMETFKDSLTNDLSTAVESKIKASISNLPKKADPAKMLFTDVNN